MWAPKSYINFTQSKWFDHKKGILLITQLYAVITEQNKTVSSELQEIISTKSDQQRPFALENQVQNLQFDLDNLMSIEPTMTVRI